MAQKKKLSYLASVVFILAVTTFILLGNSKDDSATIRIAGNIPLTGDLAVYGSYIKDGSEMAYDDLGANYTTVPHIVFDWQDNRGSTKDTVSVFTKQSFDKPDIYISGLKPQTAAITDMVTKKNIPHFTWILDQKINQNSNNNLRIWTNLKIESDVFKVYLQDKHPKKVYFVYANLPAAVVEYEQVLRPYLISTGMKNEDIISEPFNLDTRDFDSIMLKVKKSNADVVIVNGFIPHIVDMVRQSQRLDIKKNTQIVASIDMLDAAQLIPKEELEGILVASPSYLVKKNDPIIENWKKEFTQRYGRVPTYHDAYAYDMMKVVLQAASTLSFPATSEDWIQAVREVKTTGITGTIKLDEDGSSVTEMFLSTYENGELVQVKN